MSSKISIVMPVLDEVGLLPAALERLQALRERGHELICVDGGSTDATPALCRGGADRLVHAPRGRAVQMNAGARVARGDVLLFLHVDTSLPAHADRRIQGALQGRRWGFFSVRLDGGRPVYRIIERAMSLRSRWSGIGTGDQALFVERALFEHVGGFPDIALMEDVALSRRLCRTAGRPAWIPTPVTSSARYWERHGVWRSVLRMWILRAAFALGADPVRLHARYYR